MYLRRSNVNSAVNETRLHIRSTETPQQRRKPLETNAAPSTVTNNGSISEGYIQMNRGWSRRTQFRHQ